jgi:fucokinase
MEPGDPFNIPKAALRMTRIVQAGESLQQRLANAGGGLEIHTSVRLPIGSGLGTSSILSASLMKALAEMMGLSFSDPELSDQVLRLEQLMTTGGGWQDQVGGMFPGIKLTQSGPGLQQRLRVEPLALSADRVREFNTLFILYYTGIRRIAKDLLVQVVGRYLAREVEAVQVLHSIKTLASEMAYAMREGEWDYLGSLMDRHWELNQKLDPNTTNSLIESLIREVRPYVAGLKLAGAGGGGFLMLLAKDFQAARSLRDRLSKGDLPGSLHEFEIAKEGLVVYKE